MKVEDFVRVKDDLIDNQFIRKIEKIIILTNENFGIKTDNGYFYKEQIIKSSPNIIDLIEVGDYVNGCPVLHKENNELVCSLLLKYKEENIQNIVTKEQFESMVYKIGG